MTNASCPSDEALRAYCADLTRNPAIQEHLENCDPCTSRVSRLRFERAGTQDHSEFATRSEGNVPPRSQAESLEIRLTPPIRVTSIGSEQDSGEANPQPNTTSRMRFRIVRFHAEGNLGRVSLARDWELNREVALKQIKESIADDPSAQARFVAEAEITGGLEHPGVVPVYALGTYDDGRPYYAMRFIRGETMLQASDQFFAERARNWREIYLKSGDDRKTPALRMRVSDYLSRDFRNLLTRFVTVCNAIAYAHTRGVLHRDLKPANIMLGKYSETLVVDWGLAKALGASEDPLASQLPLQPSQERSAETSQRTAIGTPAYMSPEQTGRVEMEFSPQTDIYLLGATLYHLLTGRAPHTGRTLRALFEKVIAGDFAAPSAVSPAVPKPLEVICLKAMANLPQDRYGSALDLAADIERYLADEEILVRRDSWFVRCRRWLRKRPGLAASLGSAFLVGVIGLAWNYFSVAQERHRFERRAQVIADIYTLANDLAEQPPALLQQDQKLRQELRARLEKVEQELESGIIDDPLLNSQLKRELGEAHQKLHDQSGAVPLLVEAGVGEMKFRHEAARDGKLNADQEEPGNQPDSLQVNPESSEKPPLDTATALAVHKDLLAKTRNQFGENDPWTILAKIQLASAYRDQGNLEEAQRLYRDALEQFEMFDGRPNEFYVQYGPLNLRTQIAVAHIGCRDFDAAEKYVKEIRGYNTNYTLGGMFMRRTGYARDAMRKIASAYVKAERSDLAEKVLKEALTESARIFGKDDAATIALQTELNQLQQAFDPDAKPPK